MDILERRWTVSILAICSLLAHGEVNKKDNKIMNNGLHAVNEQQSQNESTDLLTSILDKLTVLDQRVASLDQRLTNLENGQTSIANGQTWIEQRVTCDLDQRFTSLNHLLTSLDQRLTSQDDRFASLENLENRLANFTCGSNEENNYLTGPFKFRSIYQETLYDGSMKLKVTYSGQTEPAVRLRYRDMNTEPDNNLLDTYGHVDHARRTVQMTFPEEEALSVRRGSYSLEFSVAKPAYFEKPYSLNSEVNSSTGSFDEPSKMTHEIANTSYVLVIRIDDDSPEEMELPNIDVTLFPGHDVTYSSGSDVEVGMVVKYESEEGRAASEDFGVDSYGVYAGDPKRVVWDNSGDTGGPGAPTPWPVPVMEVDSERERETKKGKKITRTLHINSTATDTDALFIVYSVLYPSCSVEKCIVDIIRTSTQLRYYREDRSGPFPAGLLAFVDSTWKEEDRVSCSVQDGHCDVMCAVFSEADATVSIVTPDSESMELETRRFDPYFAATTYMPLHQMYVRARIANLSLDDSGDYVCVAQTSSKSITKTIRVDVWQRPEIDRENSAITVLENGTLQGVCIASGVPAPDVKFSSNRNSAISKIPITKYNVTYIKEENRAVATLTIPDPHWASKVDALRCVTFGGHDYWGSDWYYIKTPSAGHSDYSELN